jgi:hypothetical protein
MYDIETWRDDGVKFYAMALAMANHMEPGTDERRHFQALALERLAQSVADDAARRRRCRDTDVAAATRVRAW